MASIKGFSLSPLDVFRLHFLVYDSLFRKVGTLDFRAGFWFFSPINSKDCFMGFTREDALRMWQASFSV